MADDIEFEALVDHVRTQSAEASGSDTDRVSFRSLDEVTPAAVRDLVSAVRDGGADPGDLEFVCSPVIGDRLLESAGETEFDALEADLGYPIRLDEGMPDDAILLLDPDAVDGAEIREPTAVACGTLGKAT